MTEPWSIALFTTVATLFTGVLGWIAYELHGLRSDMRMYVMKDDCSSDMGKHCTQIGELFETAKENQQRISHLETAVEIYHKKN